MADSAGRAEDQDAIAGADLRRLDERLPGGQPGERQRRGLDVVERLRRPGKLAGRRRHVLRVRSRLTREARHPEHPITGREPGHAEAHGLDGAGDVPANGEWRLPEKRAASAGLPVDRVDAGRGNAHEHLGRPRLRPWHVDELEHLRPTEHLLADRTHAGVVYRPRA